MTDGPSSGRWRSLFLVVLGFWMVLPLVHHGTLALDALPYTVAGDILTDHPDAVYTSSGNVYDPDERFAERTCELAPTAADYDCGVAFVSTPLVLPITVPLAALGDVGTLVMRVVAAGALCGGMLLLWGRLVPSREGTERWLLMVALLLTPLASLTIAIGQTSPLLFLSVALGTAATTRSRGRAAAVSVLWVMIGALKLYPFVLGPLLVIQRRWRVLVGAAVVLVVLVGATLLVAPSLVFGEFIDASMALSEENGKVRNPYSGTFETVVNMYFVVDDAAIPTAVSTAVRVLLLVVGAVLVLRIRDLDAQWAFASLVVLLALPIVWWHYLWVAIGALGVALGSRPGPERKEGLLVAMSGATLPISLGAYSGWPSAAGQFLFIVCSVAATYRVASGSWVDHGIAGGRRQEANGRSAGEQRSCESHEGPFVNDHRGEDRR